MLHYTYKISSPSGKYYIGRHSTNNIDDGYMGSGKWVKSVKDKSKLKKDILDHFESFDQVVEAEQLLLNEHINNENCMNYSNNSCGFGTGIHNVSHDPDVIKKRSENHWTKTESGKQWISENNPSKMDSVKEKRRAAIYNSEKWTDQWNLGENHHSKDEEHKNKLKIAAKNRERIECPHCGKICTKPLAVKYHLDKCKYKSKIIII